MSLITVKDISFTYPAIGNGFSLKNISLILREREFVSILGPNGSGKSTLLKIMSGILKPDKGEILLNNKKYGVYSYKEIAKEIAFVPQDTFSIFPFSIYEIVMMGRTPYLNFMGYENEEDHRIVDEALEKVGIKHLKNKGINEVSGGEAQRAFLARALVQKPAIILLDEPNAHLDVKHQISFFNLLKELNENEGLSVVFVSHDLNLSAKYGNRSILIKEGSIFMDDEKSNVLTAENIRKIFEVNSEVRNSPDDSIHVLIKTK